MGMNCFTADPKLERVSAQEMRRYISNATGYSLSFALRDFLSLLIITISEVRLLIDRADMLLP
jgi:hypothetical protein